MSATLKHVYAPGPQVERGKPVHLGADPKGEKLLYGSVRNAVIRNLDNLIDSDVYSQHNANVTVAKYAPSGYYIASGDSTGRIRIWDTINAEHILKIELPVLSGAVIDIAWTEDSKRIIAVGEGREHFGAVFEYDTGSTRGEISGHSKTVNSCDFKPSRPYRAVTAGLDNLVNFFPGPPFKFEKSNKLHTRFANCVRYSPDGSQFASAGSDKRIYIYDGKTGDNIKVLANEKEGGHTAGIYSISWNKEGTKLLSASADKTAKIFDVESGKCETTFKFAEKPTTDHQQLSCIWIGNHLITLSLGGVLSFLDVSHPEKPLRQVHGHNQPVWALAWDRVSNHMWSGDASGKIIRWKADTAENVGALNGHANQVRRIVLDGEHVISTAMDDTIRFAKKDEPHNVEFTTSLATEGLPADLAAVHNTAVLVTNKAIQLFHNAALSFTNANPGFQPSACAISVDGKEVAVGSEEGVIHIYSLEGDAKGLKEVRKLEGHRGPITSIAYSPDGTKIASGGKMRLVRVWNKADGKAIITDEWTFHSAPPLRVRWSLDSKRVVSGGLDSDIYVWNMEEPSKRIRIAQAHPLGVTDVLFVNNHTIASTGYDATTRTWSLE